MRAKLILAFVLILFALASSAGAFEYKLGYDFGNPFDENNNYSPIDYPYGIHNYPSPGLLGEGGENFDLEGLHFAMVGNTVHIALVNSFGLSAHSVAWNRDYALGDIFFGFNGENATYAINPVTQSLYSVSTYTGIPNMPGTFYNNLTIRNLTGAYHIISGDNLGLIDHEYTRWTGLEENPLQGAGDTWVMEFAFDKSLLDWNGVRTVNFHNTLGCGNDVINKSFEVIPEPSSFFLLGLGLLGTVLLVKKS